MPPPPPGDTVIWGGVERRGHGNCRSPPNPTQLWSYRYNVDWTLNNKNQNIRTFSLHQVNYKKNDQAWGSIVYKAFHDVFGKTPTLKCKQWVKHHLIPLQKNREFYLFWRKTHKRRWASKKNCPNSEKKFRTWIPHCLSFPPCWWVGDPLGIRQWCRARRGRRDASRDVTSGRSVKSLKMLKLRG